eukprot:TRINITY_DN13580_c0_g1_i1.p1 TRINITY_DN13580_c0_g1~~TRINITY_DN13580_c0_g1_i1.p1  ORF type:complete len:173 (-),score=21.77 TRINITY_DN13580_c0_g1_i1:30-548(-)
MKLSHPTLLLLGLLLAAHPMAGKHHHCRPTSTYAKVAGMQAWCDTHCAAGHCPATHCDCSGKKVEKVKQDVCTGVGAYATVPGISEWCRLNCARGFCPSTHCSCTLTPPNTNSPTPPPNLPHHPTPQPKGMDFSQCRAHGEHANTPGMHEWCKVSCGRGYCPGSHCECLADC